MIATKETLDQTFTHILQQGRKGASWPQLEIFLKLKISKDPIPKEVHVWIFQYLKQQWKKGRIEVWRNSKKEPQKISPKEPRSHGDEGMEFAFMRQRKKLKKSVVRKLEIPAAKKGRIIFIVRADIRKKWLGLDIDAPVTGQKYCVIEAIGRCADTGILQKDLAKDLNIEPKEIFTLVKHLEKLELIIRHPVHMKEKTNRIWLKRYQFRGHMPDKRYTQENSNMYSHESVCYEYMEEKERDKLIDTHIVPFLVKLLRTYPDRTAKEHELRQRLAHEFNFKQSDALLRLGRQIKFKLVKRRLKHLGTVESVRVQQSTNLQNRALRLLDEPKSPLKDNGDTENQRIAEQRINQQVYRVIWSSGNEGMHGSTLHKTLNLSHKLIYKRLQGFKKLYNVHKVPDSHHKSMVYRYFANEFCDSSLKKFNANENSRKRTLKFVKRCSLVLELLKKNNGIMGSNAMRKGIYFSEGNVKDDIQLLDMKTSIRLFERMQEEGKIKISHYNVVSPNGFREKKMFLSLPHVDLQSQRVKDLMSNMMGRGTNQVVGIQRCYPVLTQQSRPNQRAKSPVQRGQQSLVTSLLFGYVKPKMLRVRILHEILWKRRLEGWRFSKRKPSQALGRVAESPRRLLSDAPHLLPKQRRHVETAATVHVDILKKLTCRQYLHIIGADVETAPLSNPKYQNTYIEKLPQDLFQKVMSVKGSRARRPKMYLDILRRMKLIKICPQKSDDPINECYLKCAEYAFVEKEKYDFKKPKGLEQFWTRLSKELCSKLRSSRPSRGGESCQSYLSDSDTSEEDLDFAGLSAPLVEFCPKKLPEMHVLPAWQTRTLTERQEKALAERDLDGVYGDLAAAAKRLTKLGEQQRTSAQRVATFFATRRFSFVAETQQRLEPPSPKKSYFKRPPIPSTDSQRPKKKNRIPKIDMREGADARNKSDRQGSRRENRPKIRWNKRQDAVLLEVFEKCKETVKPENLETRVFYQAAMKEIKKRTDVFPSPRGKEQVKRRWNRLSKDSGDTTGAKRKRAQEEFYARVGQTFKEKLDWIPVCDRIKMALLEPDEAYDQTVTTQWINAWPQHYISPESQHSKNTPQEVWLAMRNCYLVHGSKKGNNFYAHIRRKPDKVRLPVHEFQEVQGLRETKIQRKLTVDSILNEMIPEMDSSVRAVGQVKALWHHLDADLAPGTRVGELGKQTTIERPAAWHYLQAPWLSRESTRRLNLNEALELCRRAPARHVTIAEGKAGEEILQHLEKSKEGILTQSQLVELVGRPLDEALHVLVNLKRIQVLFGWDEPLFFSLEDTVHEKLSEQLTCVPFTYEEGGRIYSPAEWCRHVRELAARKEAKKGGRRDKKKRRDNKAKKKTPTYDSKTRRDWLHVAPWMTPDGDVDARIHRFKIAVTDAIYSKPGISLRELERSLYESRMFTPNHILHICTILELERKIHIRCRCMEVQDSLFSAPDVVKEVIFYPTVSCIKNSAAEDGSL